MSPIKTECVSVATAIFVCAIPKVEQRKTNMYNNLINLSSFKEF